MNQNLNINIQNNQKTNNNFQNNNNNLNNNLLISSNLQNNQNFNSNLQYNQPFNNNTFNNTQMDSQVNFEQNQNSQDMQRKTQCCEWCKYRDLRISSIIGSVFGFITFIVILSLTINGTLSLF